MTLSRDPMYDWTKEQFINALLSNALLVISAVIKKDIQWLFEPLNRQAVLAVHVACQSDPEIIKYILKQEPSLKNATDIYHRTPVIWAAGRGNASILNHLVVDLKANINLATHRPNHKSHGLKAIHWATIEGHYDCVEILVEAGALDALSNDDIHPIYFANLHEHFSLIKLFLDLDPSLLNKPLDDDHQTLLIDAALNGDSTLLAYLIELKADLNVLADGNYTALDYATMHGHEECVKILVNAGALNVLSLHHPIQIAVHEGHYKIVKFYLNQDESLHNEDYLLSLFHLANKLKYWDIAALLFINTSKPLHLILNTKLVFSIIKLAPALCEVLLQDQRIYNLIHASPQCKTNEEFISHYRIKRGRSLSTYTVINKATFESSVFKRGETLGAGKYGDAAKFTNKKGETRAVKALLNDVVGASAIDIIQTKAKTEREMEFLKEIHPVENSYDTFHFEFKEDKQSFYNNRLIMPFFGKQHPKSALKKITCVHQLAEKTLGLAKELLRIHNLGIIHGDITKNNIIMDPEIRYIDCGLSYRTTDTKAPTFKLKLNQIRPLNHAPERFYRNKKPSLLPNTNQDIYSFGSALEHIFIHHPSYECLIKTFPSIDKFIDKALSTDPNLRPQLQDFCKQLSDEITDYAETRLSQRYHN